MEAVSHVTSMPMSEKANPNVHDIDVTKPLLVNFFLSNLISGKRLPPFRKKLYNDLTCTYIILMSLSGNNRLTLSHTQSLVSLIILPLQTVIIRPTTCSKLDKCCKVISFHEGL